MYTVSVLSAVAAIRLCLCAVSIAVAMLSMLLISLGDVNQRSGHEWLCQHYNVLVVP